MPPTLTINQRTYNHSDLAALPNDTAAAGDNQRAALAFCHQWLNGAQEFVVRTSGSTGDPKPIVLRREQMIASAEATGRALGLQPGMSALVCLPVQFIAGQMMLVRGMVLGLNLIVVEPASDPFANLPVDASIDFTALVPLQLQTLLDGPPGTRARLNRMHAILVGGAPVSASLEERIRSLTAPVYHTYGMTETATHVALRRLNGPDASPDFHPLPGVQIDNDDRGCLRVKGPMTGDRWLQTNDLVELPQPRVPSPQSPPPTFHWLGRWDNVINSGGVKVQVEKVEAVVEQVWQAMGLASRRFFVAGQPDEKLGQAVTLVIEGDPLDADSESRMRAAAEHLLDRYEAPRQVVYLPRFAETASGKIDRLDSLRQTRSEAQS